MVANLVLENVEHGKFPTKILIINKWPGRKIIYSQNLLHQEVDALVAEVFEISVLKVGSKQKLSHVIRSANNDYII